MNDVVGSRSSESFLLDLRSDHWQTESAGQVHYWDSLGNSSIPTDHLDAGSYSRIEDNWSAVQIRDEHIELTCDIVRSRPLFYSRTHRDGLGCWVVTDTIQAMREHLNAWMLDVDAAAGFELVGFSLNERTLIEGVLSVEAGSTVRLDLSGEGSQIDFWGVPLYSSDPVEAPERFSEAYAAALDGVFGRLLARTGNRQIVVPLSGGLDSRLVVVWLRRLHAPNVLAFTYGRPGSSEANFAREVAETLGFPFASVPLDPDTIHSVWFSREADGFREATWRGSSLPHVQDWFALTYLRDCGAVESDAVFLPGHTPVGMMHTEEVLRGAPATELQYVLAEHHALASSTRRKLEENAEFRRAVRRALAVVPPGARYIQNAVEWFNVRERQAKYINNSMSSYEYFGWDWALPLFWPEALSAWLSGAEHLTSNRSWYRDFIDAAFARYGGLNKPEYFAPPAEAWRIPMREAVLAGLRKSGANKLLSRLWKLRIETSHPLALEAFSSRASKVTRILDLVTAGTLRSTWVRDFLRNRWGSKDQFLLPSPPPPKRSEPLHGTEHGSSPQGEALVDVVVAVHDPSRPIARAVESVVEGSEIPVRVIVVAHNLPAAKIADALGPWATDPHVTITSWIDGIHSPAGPMNRGFDLATAPYVSLLGSDDTLQPGTLDRWVDIADHDRADFVIANRKEPDGYNAATPPVRWGRRSNLDGVKDRLSYRAAPLGLMRRSSLGDLRFPPGIATGEDIAFSARIWFADTRVSFAFGEPGYVVHADQAKRVTTERRPVKDTLSWLEGVLDPRAPWMQSTASRQALLTKLLRQNIPDTAASRISGGWDERDQRQMRAALLRIYRADPTALDYVSSADWNLLTALVCGHATRDEVARLLEARQNLRSLNAVIPHRPSRLLSRQGPLRTHLAGAALAHSRPPVQADLSAPGPAVGDADVDTARGMIFHAPFPVEEGATSASGIRPWKMLEAFRGLGYDVFVVTGYAAQRRSEFARLRSKIARGWKPEFCYSEAATIPSSFTQPRHFPLVLNLDRDFFRYLRHQDVPIGVFYRDVYWSFPEYERQVGKTVAAAMRRLYHREIETFNRYVDVVFLPTKRMANFVPDLRVRSVALPPGAEPVAPTVRNISSARAAVKEVGTNAPEPSLKLLYVGDVGGEHYDVSELLAAVKETDGVTLTICTRTDSWDSAREEYEGLLGDGIDVVHESGEGLLSLYDDADIACLVMRPQEYRSFAAPMKLYEYLGRGKPVLASTGTHAAEVVADADAGWTVRFDARDIAKQLQELRQNPAEVAMKAEHALQAGQEHTWEQRARLAAEVLTGVGECDHTQPLHVLVLPSWYPKDADDAAGSFFREQAEALATSGIEVGVLALEERPIYARNSDAATSLEMSEENGLHVLRGSIARIVPFQRLVNAKLARPALRRAWETYTSRYGVPDVIHAHSLYPAAFLAAELAQSYDVPFVYTEHRTLDHMPARTALAKQVERSVAEAAASRHAVSRGHAEHLRQRFDVDSWEYTPNLLPVVVEGGELADQVVREDGGKTFTFGHLSILDPVKRVGRLLEAFAEVHAEDATVRLVIGGSGEELPALRQRVADLELADVVTFLGHVPRSEVAEFYGSIDAFVLPSSSEPMGVVQIEALAAGVPVISTRTWGGNTVIEDDVDGLLVDIDDHEALVAAMKQVRTWRDIEARQRRRQRAIARFGRDAFVDRYQQIYRSAVGE